CGSGADVALHPFPTRRSSDLALSNPRRSSKKIANVGSTRRERSERRAARMRRRRTGAESHPLRSRKAPCRTHGDLRRRSRTWVRLGESAANGEQRGCAGGAPELNPTPSVVERRPVEPTAIFEEDRERGFDSERAQRTESSEDAPEAHRS